MSRSYLLASLARYIWLFRSLPLILVLIILYNFSYLYDAISLGIPFTSVVFASYPTIDILGQFAVAVLGLTLVQSAYTAEIIRGGIPGVDYGQHEAAAALGLPGIAAPSASLAAGAAIHYSDRIQRDHQSGERHLNRLRAGAAGAVYTIRVIYNRTQQVIPLLMVATVWYLFITTALSVIQYYIERYFARGAVRELPPTPRRNWPAG